MTDKIQKDEEYLDKCFPKGKKFGKRGEAMVLLALARNVASEKKDTEFREAVKKESELMNRFQLREITWNEFVDKREKLVGADLI